MKAIDLAGPDPRPMSVLEVETLQAVVGAIDHTPFVVIQIGAERGVSTMAILEVRPDAFIFSIDIGERPEEIANVSSNESLDPARVVRGLGRSQQIGVHWPVPWGADLIFIDGDHRYEGVHEDIQLWARHVKYGGFLFLHDYIHPQNRGPQIQGRVWEAVEDQRTDALILFDEILQVDRLIGFAPTDLSGILLDIASATAEDHSILMGEPAND